MLKAYPDDISLCVVNALKVYSDRTRQFRPEGNKGPLLLSFVAPHKPIGPSTVSRWSLDVMKKAGINVSVYKAHSTRAAATSAGKGSVPIDVILSSAGWSSARTFAEFYDKPIDGPPSLGSALLDRFTKGAPRNV